MVNEMQIASVDIRKRLGIAAVGFFVFTLPVLAVWEMPKPSTYSVDTFAPAEVEKVAAEQTFAVGAAPVAPLALSVGGGTQMMMSTNAAEVSAEIAALARALQYNPKRCYEYVRNRIAWVPTWGLCNGATGCLLAGRGNEWDQGALLGALLKASGYSVRFVQDAVLYNKTDLAAWFGVPQTDLPAAIGQSGNRSFWIGQETTRGLRRFWVEANIGGTWYKFDPAYKGFTDITGVDLASVTGYDQGQFLTNAMQGATSTADYVDDANETAVRSNLVGYASALLSYIQTNAPNATLQDLTGGRKIVPETLTSYSTSLPDALSLGYEPQGPWTDIADSKCVQVTIQHAGINTTLMGYELADCRVSILYDSSDSYKPKLRVGGELVDTGNATTPGTSYDLVISVNHPFLDEGNVNYDKTYTLSLKSGPAYVIAHDFSGASQQSVAKQNRILSQYIAEGVSDTSEQMLGQGMHVTIESGLLQWQAARDMLADLANVVGYTHHFFGVMSISSAGAYYVDLPGVVVVALPRDASGQDDEWFPAFALIASGLEHGVLEQSQGANKVAASTVKLLGLSNDNSKKTFLADSSSWNTGYNVKSRLINYSTAKKNEIETLIGQGVKFLLPEDADITLVDWTGIGYVQFGNGGLGMFIGGDYDGGYSAGETWSYSVPVVNNLLFTAYEPPPLVQIPSTTAADPVDLHTGNLLFSRTDLTLTGAEPRGVSLARHYTSGQRFSKRSMGYGWTHSYDASVETISDGAVAFGLNASRDAVPMIVQNFINLQLMDGGDPDVQEWITSCLVTKWGIDQLVENAVVVRMGGRSLEYVRMPDGTYNPPPTVTTELIKTNGLFRLVERLGKEHRFNADGLLSSIVDADGNTMSLAYNAQTNLQTVTDSYSRALTFTHTSGKLTQVSDGTGRTVSFGYTDDDLTSFTDQDSEVWEYQYDTNHQMIAMSDPLDQVTTSNIYNDVGQVVTQFNGYGETWTFYCSGYEGIEVDPEGGEITHYFDDDGRNLGTEDALGNRTYNYYDEQGQLVSNVNARGFATVYQYDEDHNLTNRIDALGNKWSYEYDAAHNLVAETDPLNHTTHFGFDDNHHLTNTVDALSNETVLTYYSTGSHKGLPYTATDPNGNVTTFTYDSYGNAYTIARTDGGTVTNTWNARGDLLVARDANGNPATMTYNKRRLVTSVTDALGNTVSNVYNAAGLKTTAVDPLDRETVMAWTPTYKVASVTYPDSSVVSNRYDSRDWLIETINPRGNVTSNSYDAAGRQIAVVDSLTNTTTFAHDAAGNIVTQTNALGKVASFVYDGLNRLVLTTDALSHSVSNTFDAAGRLIAVTDESGYQSQYTYDAANRRTTVTKADGTTERFVFDFNGNPVAFYNGLGQASTFVHDGMNRVTNQVDAVGNSRTFIFDAAGNLLERHDADSAVIEYEYDNLNRLVDVAYPNTTAVHYAYNELGLRTYQSNAVAEIWYGYDPMNRLTVVTQSVGAVQSVVAYSHDLNGNRTNIVYPGSVAVGYTLDAADRITHVTDWSSRTTAYGYDDLHRKTGVTYPNATTATWDWDDASRLTRIRYANASSNFIDRVCTLDAHGNLTAMEVNAGLLPTVSPAVKRLTQNAADELTTIQTKTNPGVQNWTTANPAHDDEGNLTSDGTQTYSYDYENRLVAVSSASASVTYYYAGDGTRMASEVIEGGSTNTTIYVIDHADPLRRPLAELDASGGLIRRFVWGRGVVAQIESNGATYYFHHDGQGSTLALSDTNSVTTDQWFYSPYGETMSRTGTTTTPYQWCGGVGVRRTVHGLYFARHRYYHAGLQRWVARDPIGLAGGANLYAYGLNSPSLYYDPLGLCSGQLWFDRLGNWAASGSASLQNTMIETYPWPVAGTLNTVIQVGQGFVSTPQSIGHLGEGTGTFVGNPTFENSAGVFRDISIGASVLAAGMSALPSANVPLGSSSVGTPQGIAVQSGTPASQTGLQQVQNGTTVYRQGQLGYQNTGNAQYWSLQNPASTPGYANQMGMPAAASGETWIMGGQVNPAASVITRPAPAIPPNVGGAIEAVTQPGGVSINWFHMP